MMSYLTTLLCCRRHSQAEKYGYRPMPAVIPEGEFTTLRAAVQAEADRTLLDEWFRLDTNTVPPSYVMQPINSVLGNTWRQDEELSQRWWDIFARLQKIFRLAAVVSLHAAEQTKYYRSVTEEEVHRGVHSDPAARSRCFWLKRRIEGLQEHIQDGAAHQFIDKDWGTGSLDVGAVELRKELEEKMRAHFDEDDVVERTVAWSAGGLDAACLSEYLSAVCCDYTRRVAQGVAWKGRPAEMPPYVKEAFSHAIFSRDEAEGALQTEAFLDKIRSFYAEQSLATSSRPLVLFGPSGCGKSVATACASQLAMQQVRSRRHTTVCLPVCLPACLHPPLHVCSAVQQNRVSLFLSHPLPMPTRCL